MSRLVISAAFVVCWSSGFVGTALVLADISSTGVLAWRYLITSALLLVVLLALATIRSRPFVSPSVGECCRQPGLGVLGHVVFLGGVFGAAEAGLPSGTTALLCALQPIVVALASRLGWRDRMRPLQWPGIGGAIGAVAIAVGPSAFSASAVSLFLPAASLLGLSASALLERAWHPTSDLLVSLTIQVSAAAVCFTAAAAFSSNLVMQPSAGLAVALCWLVLISGVGGYAAYVSCLRKLGATTTSPLLLLTPNRHGAVGMGDVRSGALRGSLGGACAQFSGGLACWPHTLTKERDAHHR